MCEKAKIYHHRKMEFYRKHLAAILKENKAKPLYETYKDVLVDFYSGHISYVGDKRLQIYQKQEIHEHANYLTHRIIKATEKGETLPLKETYKFLCNNYKPVKDTDAAEQLLINNTIQHLGMG